MILITVPGEPVAWARARLKGKMHFTPGKQSGAMNDIRAIAHKAMEGRAPTQNACSVRVVAVYQWPKSWSAKRRAQGNLKTSRPDADNLAKLVCDALNGIVFADDAQVSALDVCKRYGDAPMTEVTVFDLVEDK